MSALPAPRTSEGPRPAPPLRPVPSRGYRPRAPRARSPHTRLVQSVLALFPGSEVVEHHPASQPEE